MGITNLKVDLFGIVPPEIGSSPSGRGRLDESDSEAAVSLEAVLDAMSEATFSVDLHGRVLQINRAAIELFECPFSDLIGRNIAEIVTHFQLLDFVHRSLDSRSPLAEEFSIEADCERFIQGYARPLVDPARVPGRQNIGMLIVLGDITRVRQLEMVRRDFVANLSHELKTPITLIKGFVETLLDGALRSADDTERFLQIIHRQSDRLNHIFEDLLTLSKLEEQEGRQEVELRETSLIDILQAAIQTSEREATQKKIPLLLECGDEITVLGNSRLLEQAVSNLIENAIKYSGTASPVCVRAAVCGAEAVIEVIDSGCGISDEHIPRLFERFYRADAARSRKQGGTGLGLAIVKHIAQAHGGFAAVESRLGKGSTFSIHLPVSSSLREAEAKIPRLASG